MIMLLKSSRRFKNPQATAKEIADMYAYDSPSNKAKNKFGNTPNFDTRKDLKDLGVVAEQLKTGNPKLRKDSKIRDISKDISRKLEVSENKDKKLLKNDARVQIALGQSILESVMKESRDIKLLNKQFDVDIENLERNKKNTEIYCENQIKTLDNQLEVFRSLQRNNIEKLSDEIKKDFPIWKKVLGAKTVASLIEYSNLLSEYLFNLNKVELNNPTEANVTQLVTYFSKEGLSKDNYIESQKKEVNEEIEKLKNFKGDWEIYLLESRKILSELLSDRERVVKEGLKKVVTELEPLKPTIGVDDIKPQTRRNKQAIALEGQIKEIRQGISKGIVDKEKGEEVIRKIEDSIVGISREALSNYDLVDKVSQELKEEKRLRKKVEKQFSEYKDVTKGDLNDQLIRRRKLNLYLQSIPARIKQNENTRKNAINLLKIEKIKESDEYKEAQDKNKYLKNQLKKEDKEIEKKVDITPFIINAKNKLKINEKKVTELIKQLNESINKFSKDAIKNAERTNSNPNIFSPTESKEEIDSFLETYKLKFGKIRINDVVRKN